MDGQGEVCSGVGGLGPSCCVHVQVQEGGNIKLGEGDLEVACRGWGRMWWRAMLTAKWTRY